MNEFLLLVIEEPIDFSAFSFVSNHLVEIVLLLLFFFPIAFNVVHSYVSSHRHSSMCMYAVS